MKKPQKKHVYKYLIEIVIIVIGVLIAFYVSKHYLNPYFKKNFKVNKNANITYDLYLGDSLKISYPRDFGNGIKQIIGYIPRDTKNLKQDEEFRFLISEILWFRIYKINYYQRSIANVEKILKLIETEYPETITKTARN